MKSTLLSILIFIFLTSCSYKITRTYQVPESYSVSDCDPNIFVKLDLSGVNKKYLGTIKLDDSGFTSNCSKSRAFSFLKDEACKIGANVVIINEEALPNLGSSCYRCIADLYQIEMDDHIRQIMEYKFRVFIKYNDQQNLEWSDFKNILPATSIIPYVFNGNIELRSGGASFWDGALKDFEAQGKLYTDISSVKLSFKNDSNLKHLQGLFDINQIYSKKLENYLNNGIERTHIKGKIQIILDKFVQDMFEEQRKYMEETNYGQNDKEQTKWFEIIRKEKVALGISN